MTVLQSSNLEAAMSNMTPGGSDQGPVSPGPIGKDYSTNRGHRVVKNADGSQSLETTGTVRGSTGDIPAPPGNTVTHVRDRSGDTIGLSAARAHDVVNVVGLGEMSLATAEQLGYVEARMTGGYDVTSKVASQATPAAAQEQQEDAPTELQGEAFADADAEATLGSLVANTMPSDQVGAITEIIATGEVTEATLNRAASQAGVEPGQLSEQIEKVQTAMFDQASSVVAKFGLDPQEVFNWAHENDATAIKQAMQSLAMNRNATAFGPIAESYIATMDKHSPDAILGAQFEGGVTAKRDANGVIVLTKGGQSYTWASAVRAGLVKLSAAK